jgi:hypothetical protein
MSCESVLLPITARVEPMGPASGGPDDRLRETRGRRCVIRRHCGIERPLPDFASLNPGYDPCDPTPSSLPSL